MTTAAETSKEKRTGGGDRRVLSHAISIFIVLLVSLLLFYKHFLTRGMLMHVDMTFPTTISRNLMLYSHTWWQYGSVQNIWNIQRIFWTYPLLGAAKLFSMATDRYLLILFTSTFALAGVSMYALAYHSIKRFKLGDEAWKFAPFIGAVFAALIFMYNPFSVSHLWPYFGYPGYAVLPLVFLLLIKTVDRPRPWNVVLLAVLISVAGTGPINTIWFWFMIVGYLIFHIASKRFSGASFATAGKVVGPVAVLFFLLNSAWIIPYVGAQVVNKPFAPLYMNSFSQRMLDTLSQSGTVLNNVRFTAGWGLPVNPMPSGTIWVLLSFALPVSAIVALVILRRKIARDRIVLFWSIMFAISILLATGTSFILARPYSWFLLKAPVVSSLGWVFRAADRWLVFAAVFYALILGLLVAYLLRNLNTRKNLLAEVIMIAVLVSFVPVTLSYARNVYNPTQIPADYSRVTATFEKSPLVSPLWVPFAKDGFRYDWASEKRIGPFDVYTSNASLNNLQDPFNGNSYYFWVESLLSKTLLGPGEVLNKEVMLQKDLSARLFLPLAAQYVVFDSSVPGYAIGQALKSDSSMKSVEKTKNLEVFKLDSSGSLLRPTAKTVVVGSLYDELAITQRLTAGQLQGVSFTDRGAVAGSGAEVLDPVDYLEPFDINSGFEKVGPDGRPARWDLSTDVNPFMPPIAPGKPVPPDWNSQFLNKKVSISLEAGSDATGRSLKIVNPSTWDLSAYGVAGSEIPVSAGDVYNVSTKIKYRNSVWTHVEVEGYDTRSGKWIRLVDCPVVGTGSSPWKKTQFSFLMPAGFSKIRPVLVAGWATSARRPATSWFDDIEISKLSDRFFSDLRSGPPAPTVGFKRLSPEKYQVRISNASGKFMLAFGQAYDPMWVAHLDDGSKVNPVRLYSTVNGFSLDRRGDYSLTIEYVPQGWFKQGLIVSLVSMFGCLLVLALALVWKRKNAIQSRTPGRLT